jgi:sigma-E factor negative regulatory protein RseC
VNEKTITHPGMIKSVEHDKANVMVIANSACGSCDIKGACGVSESEEKIIEIDLLPNHGYNVGQQVVVEMKQSLGTWAVLLGYFFPFLAVLAGLIIFVSIGMDEGLAGILSMALLGLYYLGLFTFRNFITKKFTYTIQS